MDMESEDKYGLITELLTPAAENMFVTPKEVDAVVSNPSGGYHCQSGQYGYAAEFDRGGLEIVRLSIYFKIRMEIKMDFHSYFFVFYRIKHLFSLREQPIFF